MVSSTFTDLQEHRAALIAAIHGHKLHANSMENDSARLVDVIDSSLQMVRDSAAYIGVIGLKYGQTPEDPERNPDNLSITELEFNEAQSLERPILLFIMGEDHLVKRADVEIDPHKLTKLNAFRDRAKKASPDSSVHRVYAVFNSVEEFTAKLGSALAELSRHLQSKDVHASSSGSQQPSLRTAEIELYRREFVRRNRRLDLDALMPADRGEMLRIPLPSIFVEPCIRRDAPPTDIARDDLDRLRRAGELVPEDDLPSLSLEEVQRVGDVYEQPAQPAFDVLGATGNQHIVLLGDPGGGKSTLARYVALALLDPLGDVRVRTAYREALPILIELRSYVAVRPPAGDCASIFEFLDRLHQTDGYHPSAAAVQAEIDAGAQVLFIFDGLDEIFEHAAREAVTTEIARLALMYTNVTTLATSRPIGYRRRILTDAGFAHYTIQDLSPEQARVFLQRWFEIVMPDEKADASYRLARIASELEASQSVRVLAGNPLLLTILAIIGKSRDLPRDRWMLYEHASAVLINHWDVNRQLKDTSIAPYIHPEDKIELLRRLAAKMQGGAAGIAGNYILKDDLERDFEAYVKDRYEVPRADAAVVARTIISRLHDRNFILAPRGAGLFGFVHRAFLEFFSASWFKNQFETKQELTFEQLFSEVFDAHASEPAWHEVLRLLAGAIDARFTARIVDRLIEADQENAAQPWRLAVALLAYAELRRPASFAEQGRNLLVRVCQMFQADTQATPRLFPFIKRHIFPQAIAIGTQWPDRQMLSRVLRQPWQLQFMYVYDHLFGTLIGAIGAGDPQIHQALVECTRDDDPSRRVVTPFALAHGWPGESTFTMLLKLADEDTNPTVRYAAIYALGEYYRDRDEARALILSKLIEGEHVFDRAPAATAYARMHPQQTAALRLLERRLDAEQEKYPRTVIVKALVERFSELPDTPHILKRIALNDPSPGEQDTESVESWYPRQGALHGLVQRWPKAPDTIAVLRDRAQRDPTPWLRNWCRTTLERVAEPGSG
ncbi:MAG TPA: DUF4062 domain-containing protein [Thermoanaerobaculia bacterium]|nr:DUF4062 domain-containing protein [Thermoanaerobaculia bacterium]